jgi:4-amino-4-deoxy-L-arabinose transferase-like glycosyltransferase
MRTQEPTGRRTRWVLVAILAVALVTRAVTCVVVACTAPSRLVTDDSPTYEEPARALLQIGRFASHPDPSAEHETVRTPGYPLFIAAVYLVFGRHHLPVILLQIVLSVGTVWIVYWLARRLFDARAGLVAAVFLTLDAASFHASQMLMTDTLFTFLLVLAVGAGYALLSDRRAPWTWALALGVALALATLVRPITYYLVVPVFVGLLVWAIAVRLPWRPCAAMLLLAVVPSIVLVGGWQVRNYCATGSGEFSHIRGYNLLWYRGAGIVALRDGISIEEARERIRDSLPPMEGWTTAEEYNLYGREGMALVRRHPVLFVRMQARDTADVLVAPAQVLVVHLLTGEHLETSPFGDLFRLAPGEYARTWVIGRPAVFAAFVYEMLYLLVLYAGAACGIWHALRAGRGQRAFHLLACGVILYFILLSAGPEAHSRFRVPFMPLLALYAGLGLSALTTHWRHVALAPGQRSDDEAGRECRA